MKKTKVRLILLLLVTAAFLYFFFRSVDWTLLFKHLTDIRWGWFILFVLLYPVHYLTRAIRWKYLLLHEKKQTSLYNRFAANAIGFTVTYIFPMRLGEVVKPLYLAKKEGMRKGFVLGTVVIERVADILTMCLILGVFFVFQPLLASGLNMDGQSTTRLQIWGILALAFALVIVLISLALIFFRDKTLHIIDFFIRPFPKKVSQKIHEISDEFIHGLKFFHSGRQVFFFIIWSFILWLGIIFFYWVFFFAYGIHISFFSLFPYVFLLLIGASIPTPGMVGGFHAFSKLGLTALYGIDVNLAVGMTIVVHAVQVVMTYLTGYVILWKEGISLVQLKKLGEEAEL
jgi:glycosyltransferase 2 family protein